MDIYFCSDVITVTVIIRHQRYVREQSDPCLTTSLFVAMSFYDGVSIASVFDGVDRSGIATNYIHVLLPSP